jgi:adenylate cyclase class 2
MTKDKKIENEIQVQIEKSQKLIEFLKKSGKFISEERQVDKYFTPAHRNFTSTRPINEWLRLRDSAGTYSINYKLWHQDKEGRTHFCDEFESVIEDIKQFELIFKALDTKPLVTVDKTRRTWIYKNYKITLDSVKGLGDFIEIEYQGKTNQDPTEVTKKMIEFLKRFNPGKITRNYVGYPFQLLFPSETKIEEY